MSVVQRSIGLFQDSPTFDRDRAGLWSGLTVGTTALLLNAAVLFMVFLLLNFPDEREFRLITERLGFGQVLALILIAGATALSTVLIPIRLLTVFWGPRAGGYFDQIVLSGITPFRFLIGKVTSQNLLLGLALFLLVPYLVLSLSFGGVDFLFLAACVVLVWLYCMTLALVNIWLGLYFNELLAGILVLVGAAWLIVLGCIPGVTHFVPFTPMPLVIQPLHQTLPVFTVVESSSLVFFKCFGCMSVVAGVALVFIYLGPLYGIIRENGTFGEVVRAGDSRRKRWIRLRYHIQRPSELAFFYENGSLSLASYEAWIRWGVGVAAITLLSVVAHAAVIIALAPWAFGTANRDAYQILHVLTLVIHGITLLLAAYVFSHNKNTCHLKLPLLRQWKATVASLDTMSFLVTVGISIGLAMASVQWIESRFALPNGGTMFPPFPAEDIHWLRVHYEGCVLLAISALTIHFFHRWMCLFTWLKTPVFLLAAAIYWFGVCLPPLILAIAISQASELQEVALVRDYGPPLAMVSPPTVFGFGMTEHTQRFPTGQSSAPFYVAHGVLLLLLWYFIARRHSRLRKEAAMEVTL